MVVGDEIYQLDGSSAVVTGSQFEKLDVPVKVYNLEIDDFHSYFVGDVPVLVHNNYRDSFFEEFPEEKGKVVVHHSVEQQILNMPIFKGLFTKQELDAIDMLRGIPKQFNSDIHLSKIRKAWNLFYKNVKSGSIAPTKENVMDFARIVDILFSDYFV